MEMTRRTFGSFTALGAAALLGGCATSAATTVTVSKIEGDMQLLLNGVEALVGSPALTALLPATTISQIQGYETNAQGVLTDVEAAASTVLLSTAQGWVAQLETDVGAVVSLVDEVPGIPTGALTVINAINALLPIVLASVSMLVTQSAVAPSGLSPDDARKVLTAPPKF